MGTEALGTYIVRAIRNRMLQNIPRSFAIVTLSSESSSPNPLVKPNISIISQLGCGQLVASATFSSASKIRQLFAVVREGPSRRIDNGSSEVKIVRIQTVELGNPCLGC